MNNGYNGSDDDRSGSGFAGLGGSQNSYGYDDEYGYGDEQSDTADNSGFGSGFASAGASFDNISGTNDYSSQGMNGGYSSTNDYSSQNMNGGYGSTNDYSSQNMNSGYSGTNDYSSQNMNGGYSGTNDYSSQNMNGGYSGTNDYSSQNTNSFGQQDNYDPNAPLYRPEDDFAANAPLYSPNGSGFDSKFDSQASPASKYNMSMTITKGKYTWILIIALVLFFISIGGFILYKALFEKKSIKEYWESSTGQDERALLKKEFLAENPDVRDFDIIAEGDDVLVYEVTYDKVNFTAKEREAADAYFELVAPSMKQEIQKIIKKAGIRDFSIVFRFKGKADNTIAEYTYKLNE